MSLNLSGVLQVVKRAASKHVRLVEDTESGYFNDEGIHFKGPQKRESVFLSWQPITGKELLSIEAGDRTKEARKFWSLTQTKLADKIVIGDEIFTVRANQYWEALNINGKSIGFWEGYMIRSGEKFNLDPDA